MRIQILTQYYAPEIGAAQVRLGAMTRALVAAGHQVDIVTPMPNYPHGRIFPAYRRKLWSRESIDGAQVFRTWISAGIGAGIRRFGAFVTFAGLAPIPMWRAPKPDVVLVESPPLFAVLPALAHRFIRRVPYVMLVADLWPDSAVDLGFLRDGPALKAMFWLERVSYRYAARVAPVTEGQVATLRDDKAVEASRILFMPNGVDLEMFRPGPASPEIARELAPHGERVILFAGNHGYAQGVDVLLDAAPLVRARHPDARIVLVGSGSERERLVARVRDERIEGVAMLDQRPLADIAEMLRVAVAGVTTLRRSPVFDSARPSRIFPVMASARPIVYSGAGEGARLIENAGAGIVTAPEDPRALADGLIAVLDDPARAAQLGANGRALVEAEFSWDSLIAGFVSELERLR